VVCTAPAAAWTGGIAALAYSMLPPRTDPSSGGLANIRRSVRWQVRPIQPLSIGSRDLELLHQAAWALRQPKGGTTQRSG
jgi:hypothetical protein